MMPGLEAATARLDADKTHRGVIDEVVEEADGIAAAAHTGNRVVGQAPFALHKLCLRLAADDGLKARPDGREGVRTDRAPDQVVGGLDVRYPAAHRLIDRVLESLAALLTGRTVAPRRFMRSTFGA